MGRNGFADLGIPAALLAMPAALQAKRIKERLTGAAREGLTLREKRSRSNRLWAFIGLASMGATLMLLWGFGNAALTLLRPSHADVHQAAVPAAREKDPVHALAAASELRVTALGDSLTKGTGDATGEGYVKQAVEGLREKTGKKVTLVNNLGIRGQRADQLVRRLQTNGYRYAVRRANVILLTIGGNDLFASAREAMSTQNSGEGRAAAVRERIPEGLRSLDAILKSIHAINPDALVVYIGLYNPFYDLSAFREGSLEVAEWNAGAYKLVHRYEHMLMVPVYDLFEASIGSYLSSDHFHPNHDGYARIAERIVQSVTIEGT